MDKKFWVSIKENKFSFPDGYSIDYSTEELIAYIGSTDPELRDTIGLEAFYHWLKQGLYSVADLRGFITRLLTNLQQNIGETESDTVSIFRYNEDSRIAQPALWIFFRTTLPLDQTEAWVASLTSDWNGAWQNEDRTRAYNNGRNFMRALYWYTLMKGGHEIPNKEAVLKLLQAGLEQAKPWEW